MATVLKSAKNQWLITPHDIMERSALLQFPTKKWMTVLNTFITPLLPGNARELRKCIQNNQLRFPLDQEAQLLTECERILAPAAHNREFPKWYKFNTTRFVPMDHQVDALKRIYPVNTGGLLMEMGTAKTRVLIDLMTAHFFERRIQFVIVVAPVTVKLATWMSELRQWSPCPVNVIDVEADYNAKSLRVFPDRLTWLIVGTESLSNAHGRVHAALAPVTKMNIPYGIAVDESARIANYKTIVTQACFDLRRNATIRMIMTGFELKRNLQDLYSQFEFLDPNIIGCGDYVAFRNRYCIMGGYKRKELIGYNNVEELMGLIAPYVYQCDKSVLKLPPKLYERRLVALSKEQKLAYMRMKAGDMEGTSIENVLTRTLRLQQICSGYYNTDSTRRDEMNRKVKVEVQEIEIVKPSLNPKLRELLAVAREISHPMIVWVQSMYEYRIVVEALSKLGEVISLIGETPRDERKHIVERFQGGNIPYFVGTESAGGIGITLTAARTVAYFSNGQKLGDRMQSEDRAHRKGQEHPVSIIDFLCKGTVEMTLNANHRTKLDLAMYVKNALRERIAMEKYYEGLLVPEILQEMAVDPGMIEDLMAEQADMAAAAD